MNMEQNTNDENTICARLEKALMDAVDAADETITEALDLKDPVVRMVRLTDGYRTVLEALLPNEDIERLHLADKLVVPNCHTHQDVDDMVRWTPPFCKPPYGHAGVDLALEAAIPPAPRSQFKALADDHGLRLSRFSGAGHVLVCGVRERDDGRKTLWRIEVDKESRAASVQEDGDEVFRVISGSVRRCEMIAVRGLLAVLKERLRQARRHK